MDLSLSLLSTSSLHVHSFISSRGVKVLCLLKRERALCFVPYYEGESVNRSQMGIKRKTCDTRTWKKNIHFSIYPPPTLILLSQPLPHLRFKLFVVSEMFSKFLAPVVNRFTRQTLLTLNRKQFCMNIFCCESFCPHKCTTLLFGSSPILLKHDRHFDYWNQPLKHAGARLLSGLSWKWTVLLPRDTHRRPIESITTTLLSFVTYLLTLSRNMLLISTCKLLR
jgi:hypothetical protein